MTDSTLKDMPMMQFVVASMAHEAHGITDLTEWRRWADAPTPPRPARMSRGEYSRLSESQRIEYDQSRLRWASNMGIIGTDQFAKLEEVLGVVLSMSQGDKATARVNATLSADATLGKSTWALTFGKLLHREMRKTYPERFAPGSGYYYSPVVYIDVPGNATRSALLHYMAQYLNVIRPGERSSEARLNPMVKRGLDRVGCRLLIMDDLHGLSSDAEGKKAANALKSVSNIGTLNRLDIGIDLASHPFFNDWQNLGRATLEASLEPEAHNPGATNGEWITTLEKLESRLRLLDHVSGDLVAHADNLHSRTQGRISSLMMLIKSAWAYAVISGSERLTKAELESGFVDGLAKRLSQQAQHKASLKELQAAS